MGNRLSDGGDLVLAEKNDADSPNTRFDKGVWLKVETGDVKASINSKINVMSMNGVVCLKHVRYRSITTINV